MMASRVGSRWRRGSVGLALCPVGEGGGVRSGPGAARTILLSHIISARPLSKQPLMVRTFLKVYMELGFYFLSLQEQIKDIIIMGVSVSCASVYCVSRCSKPSKSFARTLLRYMPR